MSRYRFELATAADDADLRGILASTPMPGNIALSFRREPSYFAAAVVEGRFRQVVAARHTESNRVVGFGARSISIRYINGEPMPVGYLSSLRLLAEHRDRGLVARGYRFFRELHSDRRTGLYLTTISATNRAAIALLTSGRAGLPHYRPAGEYHTIALSLARPWPRRSAPRGVELRSATRDDVPELIDFWTTSGSRRQFFPQYDPGDLFGADGLLHGLGIENIVLAVRGGRIIGTAGCWDQNSFRQTVITAYRGAIRLLRPLNNALAPLIHGLTLPPPGSALRSAYVAVPVVDDDEPELFVALLGDVAARAARQGCDHLLLGLHERDPLICVARTLRGTWYTTRLYLVTWDDGCALDAGLDERPPYLEPGCL